jgi:hypothetical protein
VAAPSTVRPISVHETIYEQTPNVTYNRRWGGWDSNPWPTDYEKCGLMHRAHYLHGYHGIMPPKALIAPFAPTARSTNRSTHSIVITGCQLQNVTADRDLLCQGLRQAGDVVYLDYPPFFIDRVEDAVPPGPQAPQIQRSVRERLRRPRLNGELANSVPERSDTDGIVVEEARRLI